VLLANESTEKQVKPSPYL